MLGVDSAAMHEDCGCEEAGGARETNEARDEFKSLKLNKPAVAVAGRNSTGPP